MEYRAVNYNAPMLENRKWSKDRFCLQCGKPLTVFASPREQWHETGCFRAWWLERNTPEWSYPLKLDPLRPNGQPYESTGRNGRAPAKCGTNSGYQRHRRKGEDPCEACTEARRLQSRENWAKRKAREALAGSEMKSEPVSV